MDNTRGIDETPLISKPELVARLLSHRRPGKLKFTPDLTITDIAHWCSVSYTTIYKTMRGQCPVTSRLQVRLTQFYLLWDSGHLRLDVNGKHKHFARVDPGKTPPPAERRDPRVEFTPTGPVLKT